MTVGGNTDNLASAAVVHDQDHPDNKGAGGSRFVPWCCSASPLLDGLHLRRDKRWGRQGRGVIDDHGRAFVGLILTTTYVVSSFLCSRCQSAHSCASRALVNVSGFSCVLPYW